MKQLDIFGEEIDVEKLNEELKKANYIKTNYQRQVLNDLRL